MNEAYLRDLCRMKDPGTCVYAYCCLPCFSVCWLQAHSVSEASLIAAGKLSVNDAVEGDGMFVPFLVVMALGCVGGVINRRKIRKDLGLEQNFCVDAMMWTCCPICAALQEDALVRSLSPLI